MLRIENLHVEVAGKEVLKGVNLHIKQGEVLALFGPNGSGKTTLIMAIMGFSNYRITEGSIIFKGELINYLSMDEKARLGIGILYQRPPTVRGVKTRQMAEISARGKVDITAIAERLNLTDLLDRDVNLGFSGGEIKRSELFQLIAQDPELALLDEPESGVDLENISLIGKEITNFFKGKNPSGPKSGLIITHTGDILDYVKGNKGCVMVDGSIYCDHSPRKILENIRRYGYERCMICEEKKINCQD
jgi:Fe-S cluster assembly ATP-binding protein